MVTNYDGEQVEIPQNLPMLPVRDIVVFPYMIIPLFVGRDSSIKSVEEALSRSDRLILLASQKEISDEHPSPDGIYKTGTVAMIMRMRKLPDGRILDAYRYGFKAWPIPVSGEEYTKTTDQTVVSDEVK